MARLYEFQDEMLYCHHSLERLPDPGQFTMHAHDKLEILYVISGRGTYLVEGTSYEINPGDLFLMRHAETHTLVVDPSAPYERVAIHFPPKLIAALDPEGRLLRPFLERPLGRLNQYDESRFPTGHWKSAFEDFSFSDTREERAHLVARLFSLLPELCDAFDNLDGQEDTVPKGLSAELVAYINEHLFEDISLEDLSGVFYRSTSQLNRLFRQAVGSSLWDYVLVKRLLAARAMLQQGGRAGKACAACGFKDYSSFFRAYKGRFGCSPSSDRGVELKN